MPDDDDQAQRVPSRRIAWDQKLADADRAIMELGSTVAAVDVLCRKYDVDERTAFTWCKKAKERRVEFRRETTAEERRAELVGMAETIYASAMNATEVVRDADGNPIMEPVRDARGAIQLDPDGNPITRVKERRRPDRRSAAAALRLLSDLDGVAQPAKTQTAVVVIPLQTAPPRELVEAADSDELAIARAVRLLEPGEDLAPSTNGHSNGHN